MSDDMDDLFADMFGPAPEPAPDEDNIPGREESIQETLALLQARGARGIVSTEAVAIGIPRLQARVRDLRVRGYPIASMEIEGTEVVRYVFGVEPRRAYKRPWQAGVQAVWRDEDGSWEVSMMGTTRDKARAQQAVEAIRAALVGFDNTSDNTSDTALAADPGSDRSDTPTDDDGNISAQELADWLRSVIAVDTCES